MLEIAETALVEQADSERAWLALRKTGIGASDAPRILNKAYQLWAEKTGLSQADDISELERVKWGHRLQPVITEVFGDEAGRAVAPWPAYTIVRHQEHDWMLCTPDAVQRDGKHKGRGVLEIKTTSAYARKDWDEEPPLGYQVQLLHQMAVLNAQWGTLCVLIGGQMLRWFDFERNERFIAALIEAEAAFWQKVQNRQPPQVDGSEATKVALGQLYPEGSGDTVILPDEADAWDERLSSVKSELRTLEIEKTELENRLKAAIGDATYGLLPKGGRYSWKTQNRKAYTIKATTFRKLTRLK